MDDHSSQATCEPPAAAGTAASDAYSAPDGVSKIVVAIHGIGKQFRCDTIRAVAARFGDNYAEDIPLLPLGHFAIDEGTEVRWSVLETCKPDLARIGFAEIYWADIPRQLVQADDTLEETKAWAHTVVSRAWMAYRGKLDDKGRLKQDDFAHGIDAIDTVIEGIDVLEQMNRMFGKVLPFKFEIGAMLRDYAGDVQTVTEFPQHRNRILYRFHAMLNGIVDAYRMKYGGKLLEIYLVAHSEGTVISLLAMMQALASTTVTNPDDRRQSQGGDWVENVRGFMTIGSPIDKHIALWPKLWDFAYATRNVGGELLISSARTDAGPAQVRRLRGPIRWHNYYDHGDPVGFRLDEARDLLDRVNCGAFAFDGARDDHGFSRYLLPGKAHVDYWRDAELFRHFIDAVVQPSQAGQGASAPPPADRRFCGPVARLLPYVGAFLLHYAAVLILLQGLAPAALAQMPEYCVLALWPAVALLAVTFAVRVPQLVRHELRWMVAAAFSGALAAVAMLLLPDALLGALDERLARLAGADAAAGRWVVLGIAVVLGVLSWIDMRGHLARSRGALVGSGVLLCAALAMGGPQGMGGIGWAMVGAAIGFVGLWWLGIILFDLAFVWHRYVRNAVTVRTLRAWQHNRDAQPDRCWGLASPGDAADAARSPSVQPV